MLSLSKRVEYGLMALLHLAQAGPGTLSTAKEMAELYAIPGDLLGKVLQALVRAKLVASVQGAHGGYRLHVPVERVTLGQVIDAVDGPMFLSACQEDPAQCGQFHACTIKEPIHQLQAQLTHFVHGISLGAFRAPRAEPARKIG